MKSWLKIEQLLWKDSNEDLMKLAGQWFSAVNIDTFEDLLASINEQYRINWYTRLEKKSNKILLESKLNRLKSIKCEWF